MAALEKIRKRAVFLTIVIGVALLAFILGDFLNSGRSFFGDGNTIAKVGSTKIDAIAFQKRYEEANAQLQRNNQNADASVVQSQVMNEMINEVLLDDEIERVGIFVTDNELSQAMTGKNANPAMVQFAQQLGAETPAQLYDMLFNPTKYGATEQQVAEAKAEWLKREADMTRSLKYQKLQNLIAGAIQANDLDKKEMFEENATTCYINYVKQDYSTLKDSEYPVSDAELQAEYNKTKELYKLEDEMRRLHYISVDVVPSATDLAAAQKLINTTVAELTANAGVDGIRNNSELDINETTVRLNDVNDPDMKSFISSATAGAVSTPKFLDQTYTILKLKSTKMESDSVNVNMFTVQGDKKLQNDILAKLNAGTPTAEILKNKAVSGQENQWQMVMGVNDSVKSKLLNAGAGYFVLESSDQGAYFVRVNEKKAPKAMYDIAIVTYKVYPSTATVNNLRDHLQAFINTNNTAANFESKAIAAGYQAAEASVISTSPQINNIAGTRKAIQWLFGAEKGSVSPIYDKENNNKMVVVALDDVYEAGYIPMSTPEVKTALTAKVRNSKKGDALVAKYKGKANDINAYASLMKSSVDTTQVTFGQSFIPKIGAGESALVARVSVAQANKIQGPLKGENAVFAYVVTKQEKTSRTPGEEVIRQFAATRGNSAVMQHAIDILKKDTKVKNNIIKFF